MTATVHAAHVGEAQQPRRRVRRGVALALVALVVGASVVASGAGAQAPPVEFAAELPTPEGLEGQGFTFPGWIDESNDLLYMWFGTDANRANFLLEYDLASQVPTLRRVSQDSTAAYPLSFNNVAPDPSRNRAVILTANPVNRLEVMDLASMTITDTYEFTTVLPGFAPVGMTYYEPLDRIYMVGEFTGASTVDQILRAQGNPSGPVPSLVALDGETFATEWIQPFDTQDCPTILNSSSSGASVARSHYTSDLYVFCAGGSVGRQYSGRQNALLRVDLSSEETAGDITSFPIETFPISGNYAGTAPDRTGLASFDPLTERVFVQSVDKASPGAWVFDGLRSSWVGFIAYGDEGVNYGLNPRSGRYYMAQSYSGADGSLVVADGRATPIPQGESVKGPPVFGNLLPDPGSRRLFTNFYYSERVQEGLNPHAMVMLVDNTEPIVPREPLDYDALTHELPEDEAFVIYNAQSSGFGSRQTLVGGYQGLAKRLFPTATHQTVRSPGGIATGPRGLITSWVDGVGLSQSGAAAAAAVGAADDATNADAEDNTADVNEAGEAIGQRVYEFPYDVVTCLDGNGERIQDSQTAPGDTGSVEVDCDLANETSHAAANYAGEVSEAAASGRTSYTTRTYRDPDLGVVSETTAVSEGMRHTIAGIGTWSAERVVTTATTVANGLSGGAMARWTREVSDMAFTDVLGVSQEPRSCTTVIQAGPEPVMEDDCAQLQADYEDNLGATTRIRFPMAEVVATPGGAAARVSRTESDRLNALVTRDDARSSVPGMEVEIINDGAEKSRTVVEYASIDAFSIFTRSPLASIPVVPPQEPGKSGPAPETPTVEPTTVPGSPPPVRAAPATPDAPIDPVLATHEARLVAALGWLARVRSFADALPVAALYALFVVPVAVSRRRRRLLDALTPDSD